MVFNQALWCLHSKVLSRLLKTVDHIELNELAPCDHIPTDTKVFIEYIHVIIREYSLLKDFMKNYSSSDSVTDITYLDGRGLYWEAFSEGIFAVISNLDDLLHKIEKSYLCGSSSSMLKIHDDFVYLASVVSNLNAAMGKLKDGKYVGCKILDLCESFVNSESPEIKEVFIEIQKLCLKKLYFQLKLWLVHNKLYDPFKEFFIRPSTVLNSSFSSEATVGSLNSSKIENIDTITKYEVNADNLPSLIPFSVAVKLLFIGESLIMCRHSETDNGIGKDQLEVSGISPQNIVSMFAEIEKSSTFNSGSFINFIDELWVKVNSYIHRISIEIGNVESELTLMWEMYLLGRDELFQDFLLRGSHLLYSDVTTVTARNLNVALKDAVYYVYLTENCYLIDQFYFKLPKRKALKLGLTTWSVMYLDCKIKWPLHYLFTQEIMVIYNKLFIFLLRLKKAQMDLISASKAMNSISQHSVKMKFIEVKIHLLSIVSNLQNYCLTYVIANEMNILLANIKATSMFTELQKSLLLFLTTITNRLFISDQLLSNDTRTDVLDPEIQESVSKKVNGFFMKIFDLCGSFSELTCCEVNHSVISDLTRLKNDLFENLKLMFSLLHKINQNLYHGHNDSLHIYTHLYNLIMCLDYNKFYHNTFQLDLS